MTTSTPLIDIPQAIADAAAAAASAASKVASVSGTAPITSSGGTTPAIGINAATGAAAGSMSAADKTKLDGITSGAAVASVSGTAPVASSGGTTPAISITPGTNGFGLVTTGGAVSFQDICSAFYWAFNAGAATTAARYAPLDVTAAVNTVDKFRWTVPRAGTLYGLFGRHQAAGTGGLGNNTYTINKNGTNTAITIAIDNASTAQVSDTTHLVDVVAGDEISLEMTRASSTATGNLQATFGLGFRPAD